MINYFKNRRSEMRKNYFAKIVKYIKDVYNVEEGFRNLQDERINPTYKTDKIVLPVLFGFILRIRSFNELNYMIKSNEFKNVIPKGCKLPGIDSIRDTLKVIEINGLVVCAIDGTQTFNM
jgi:transposase